MNADEVAELPVDGPFNPAQLAELAAVDPAMIETLRSLRVDGPFSPDEAMTIVRSDIPALLRYVESTPIDGPFSPEEIADVAYRLGPGSILDESLISRSNLTGGRDVYFLGSRSQSRA